MIAKGFRDAYDIAILVSSAGACLKKAFYKMCVIICENDFSNTPEEKQT